MTCYKCKALVDALDVLVAATTDAERAVRTSRDAFGNDHVEEQVEKAEERAAAAWRATVRAEERAAAAEARAAAAEAQSRELDRELGVGDPP